MATREETKRMIEVMQAYVDGKEIELSKCSVNENPYWNWDNSPNTYVVVDPYAELKAAAKDPTKEVRCIAPTCGNSSWQHTSEWTWNYLPDQYEIRDKPKPMKKVKLLA